jgi:tetratricopeptide (TPR) repeat protein
MRDAGGDAHETRTSAGIPESSAAIALIVATFLAYLPCLYGALVWDDEAHITSDVLRTLDGLLRIWTEPGATQQYYPLLHSAFWLEFHLWGSTPLYYHAFNVLLHAGCAYLLTRILRLLNIRGAWIAGFIFALHPVCTEAVAWISEQKSTLSGIFYFGAALAYLRFDESRKRPQYALGLALFVCALLCKTVTATLPAALLLILWWRRGTIRWKQDALPLVPWLVTGAAAGIGTAWVESTIIGAHGADYNLTLLQRVLLAGRDLWFYAGKVVWPAHLTFIYPHWNIDSGQWWQYLFTAGFLVVVAIFAILARRNRAPLAATLFFAGTLFPVLGFLNVYPFRYSYVADHFQYLACIGIIVPAAWLLAGIPLKNSQWISGIALAGVLGLLTWQQTHEYTGPEALYQATLERNPSCWMAHNNLAILLAKKPKHVDEAIDHIRQAISLKADYHEAHNNLGSVLSDIPGRQADAIDEYQEALRIKPDYAEAHFNLGNEYFKEGREPEAMAEYRAAIKANPLFGAAHGNLGAMLVKDPAHTDEGLDELHLSAKYDPRSIPVLMNLAKALGGLPGHSMEAQLEYEEILTLQPRLYEARMNLGDLLLASDDSAVGAAEQFAAAVALQPKSAEARVGLSIALFKIPGKTDDAMRQLEFALRLDPENKKAVEMRRVVKERLGR